MWDKVFIQGAPARRVEQPGAASRWFTGWLPALILGSYIPLLSVVLIKAFGTSAEIDVQRVAIGAVYGSAFCFLTLRAIDTVLDGPWHVTAYAALSAYLAAFAFGYAYHFLLYGQLFGEPSVGALLDTNPREALEFLTVAMDGTRAGTAVLLALVPALMLVLAYRPSAMGRRLVPGLALSTVALAMLAFGIASRQTSPYNPIFMLARSTASVLHYKRLVAQAQTAMSTADLGAVVGPSQEAVTHVLVIGESTTRRHMSLYGYARETTPRLKRLEPEMLVVRDACASRGSTAASMREFLTFATRDDHEALITQSSLVPIMNAAGFETSWISNQQMYGKFDNWSAVFSRTAHNRTFINKVGWTDGVSLDEALLDPFRAALARPAKRKFIVLHLLGAHSDYRHRYPPAFDRFTRAPLPPLPRALDAAQAQAFNSYDNAVLYTDHVIAEIIEATRASGGGATITVLSDHGEALSEHSPYAGHIDGSTVRQVYEIPLFFWLSSDQAVEARHLLPDLKANLRLPFQIDGFLNTLLDLYGIGHPARDLRRSLASSEFRSGTRFCDQLKPEGDEAGLPQPLTSRDGSLLPLAIRALTPQ